MMPAQMYSQSTSIFSNDQVRAASHELIATFTLSFDATIYRCYG